MARGFIQIPLLIAIIVSALVFGTGEYFLSHKSSNSSIVGASNDVAATTTNLTISASSTSSQPDTKTTIDSLQKQVSDLNKKLDAKPVEQKITTTINQVQQSTTTQVSLPPPPPSTPINTFPCSKYIAAVTNASNEFSSLLQMYNDNGMDENPNKSNFDYPYNKMNAQKDVFNGSISTLIQGLNVFDTYDGTAQGKSDLTQAGNTLQVAYALQLQGFGLVNSDKYVNVQGYSILPKDNIAQAKADTNQAYAKFQSATALYNKSIDELLAVATTNGCK